MLNLYPGTTFLLRIRSQESRKISEFTGARVLALLGDSITTDHISPAGAIPVDSPAGKYLIANGVQAREFNSYGSRRGNDRVMTRGTFANIRLKNRMVPGVEGGVTVHLPDGEQMSIYDAAMKYDQEGHPIGDYCRKGLWFWIEPGLGCKRNQTSWG